MEPEKKKPGKTWLILLIVILLTSQYLAAHMSGWLATEGEWDILKLDGFFTYIAQHPFDVISFNIFAYAVIYGAGFALYFYIIFSRKPPKAEMKGVEHGSNDFMSAEEMVQYSKTRMTPDFPYSEDVTVPGKY